MKKLFTLLLGLSALATSAQAAWKFDGVWRGNGLTVFEWPQDQSQVRWADGVPGFTAFYNPKPVPAPRCLCSVYDVGDRQLLVAHDRFGTPTGGFYRGEPIKMVGAPQQF